jgi:hypothetical protein
MLSPYRDAPEPPVFVAPLPQLDTTRCYGCGVVGLEAYDFGIIVRPCAWWRRLLGCRERREHVHVRHYTCGCKWVTQPAGYR